MRNMYRAIGLTSLFLCLSAAAETPQDSERESVLARVIEVSEKHALNADRVDWPSVSATASGILRRDTSEDGLTASVRYVLSKLQDRHSLYRPPQPRLAAGRAKPKPKPIAGLSISPAGTPILAVNSWAGQEIPQAAAEVRQELVAALSTEPCGIILDFAQNSGGNMWPMVMGLLPLYSEGTLGGFVDRDGKRTSIVSTGTGLLVGGSDHFLNAVGLAQPVSQPTYIALILGKRTASSGEITALLFKGQKNIRYFGEHTAGIPTANQIFNLQNGAMFALTTAVTIDRNGSRYTTAIAPDVETDDPVGAADNWIKRSCSSQGAP